jgi:hypothetical protein
MASPVRKKATLAIAKKPRPAARDKSDMVPQEVKSFPEIHALWVDVSTAENLIRDAKIEHIAGAVSFYNRAVSQIWDVVPESMKDEVKRLEFPPINVDPFTKKPKGGYSFPLVTAFHKLRGILHKHAILSKK